MAQLETHRRPLAEAVTSRFDGVQLKGEIAPALVDQLHFAQPAKENPEVKTMTQVSAAQSRHRSAAIPGPSNIDNKSSKPKKQDFAHLIEALPNSGR